MNKDKYLQIFNYLLEFSKLRSKPVRDIENSESQYPEIIWLENIPQCDSFDCITFPSFNKESDYWFKINKPTNEPVKPTFPDIDNVSTEWIDIESLYNDSDIPKLKDSIVIADKNHLLSEHPEIVSTFNNYVETKWFDDIKSYKINLKEYEKQLKDYQSKLDIYKHFFSICNKAQHFGEEFELVVGLGLLYFRENDFSPIICRHVLTSKAEIQFVASKNQSYVKVTPGIDNDLQVETDAINDLVEQFETTEIINAEKMLLDFLNNKDIIDTPFNTHTKDGLKIFADCLRSDAQYRDDITKSKTIPTNPTIIYSPALILRKRNLRSFTSLYEKIINNITAGESDIDIPQINNIVDDISNLKYDTIESESSIENFNHTSSDETGTIYFPKKYNDEQIEIINRINLQNQVLVQGPPGTGKSHTIANLICHFLANGKKVLVTAYTKRALEVLKNQLPESFQNLTVNLLSGDSESIKDLESSVNAINDELSKGTNLKQLKKEIDQNEEQIFKIKENISSTTNQYLSIKEKSTRSEIINDSYSGTLLEIAEILEQNSFKYTWFKDTLKDLSQIPPMSEVKNFLDATRHYEGADTHSYSLKIPSLCDLITQEELFEYSELKKKLDNSDVEKKDWIKIETTHYSDLINYLIELKKIITQIENNTFIYKSNLLEDYKSNLKFWLDKNTSTEDLFLELDETRLRYFDKSIEINYSKDKTWKQIKNDANTLLSYVKEGNNLSGLLFSVKKYFLHNNIKEKLYLIKDTTVNGSHCDTVKELELLLEDLKFKQDFEELEFIWNSKPREEKYFQRLNYFRTVLKDAKNLIELLNLANKLKEQIELDSSLKVSNYDVNIIDEYIKECEHSILENKVQESRDKIDQICKIFSAADIHPIKEEVINCVTNLDYNNFTKLISDINFLNSEKQKYEKYLQDKQKLNTILPNLISDISNGSFEEFNLGNLHNAILFRHAMNEILELLKENKDAELFNSLNSLEYQEEKYIAKIASQKAWFHVLKSLMDNPFLKRHLQAWVLAVKKIGKTGTGKRAIKFRKEAQVQMDKCKDSVPCWIMPLYKVAETINPQQGMYDYVIIDEASQIGADAIFLLYISKKIIIVGDDKQTSPEYVGVDANTMTPHIKRHLYNIPFANYYGTEFSFFDHAKMFCDGMTVLREHFRCMPEIIEFSNKNFYAPDGKGLYPLKQYSENRLEPLMSVYCQNGFVEGLSQNIKNEVEAICIANKIGELVKLDSYKNKSFGVISLQGNKQASILDNLILNTIGESEYRRRKIICGNSASFQGDERDIMFLSLITATNHKRSAFVKPEDERRFNVAMSRAKEQVWLFHSVLLDDLSNSNDLRYKLLEHFINKNLKSISSQLIIKKNLTTLPEPFESWFEVDIFNDIVSKNYKVIPQYQVAKGKYRIDLVVILSNGTKIAIECDGDKFHGVEQFQNDLMRQKVLERCGWQFFRIRGAEYYTNKIKSMEQLWEILKINDHKIESSSINDIILDQEEINHNDDDIIELESDEIIEEVFNLNENSTKENQEKLDF